MSSFKDLTFVASRSFSAKIREEKHSLTIKAIPLHITRCIYYTSLDVINKEGDDNTRMREVNSALSEITDYVKLDLENWIIKWSFEDEISKESVKEFYAIHMDFCDSILYKYAEYCFARYTKLTNSVEEVKKN